MEDVWNEGVLHKAMDLGDPGLIRGTDRLWVWGMDRDLAFTQIDMMCVTIASKNCSTPIV